MRKRAHSRPRARTHTPLRNHAPTHPRTTLLSAPHAHAPRIWEASSLHEPLQSDPGRSYIFSAHVSACAELAPGRLLVRMSAEGACTFLCACAWRTQYVPASAHALLSPSDLTLAVPPSL
eukprot:2911175-Pleurochrysis_carterae.AAC.2